MNTMGKTLVIINFVFALLTGAFLIIDFATRNNWKEAFEKANEQLKIARLNSKDFGDTTTDALAKQRAAEARQALLLQQTRDQNLEFKTKLDEEKKKVKDAELKSDVLANNYAASVAELKRRQAEVAQLTEVLKQRDGLILALEKEKTKYLNDAVEAENRMKVALGRNESLLEENRLLTRKLAEKEAGPSAVTKVSPRDPTYRNPPSAYVKGIIEKIDPKDRTLVQISIGSDAGINVDHTLEVFRLAPKAEYLGTIRIVEADHHKAVGRLIRSEFAPRRSPMKEGDEVASKIMNRP